MVMGLAKLVQVCPAGQVLLLPTMHVLLHVATLLEVTHMLPGVHCTLEVHDWPMAFVPMYLQSAKSPSVSSNARQPIPLGQPLCAYGSHAFVHTLIPRGSPPELSRSIRQREPMPVQWLSCLQNRAHHAAFVATPSPMHVYPAAHSVTASQWWLLVPCFVTARHDVDPSSSKSQAGIPPLHPDCGTSVQLGAGGESTGASTVGVITSLTAAASGRSNDRCVLSPNPQPATMLKYANHLVSFIVLTWMPVAFACRTRRIELAIAAARIWSAPR
jgi:hypothetical protein